MKIEITHEAEELMEKLGDDFCIDIEVCESDSSVLEINVFEMRADGGHGSYVNIENISLTAKNSEG
jgi:hypothetical protein